MQIGTKEHYDIMSQFEKDARSLPGVYVPALFDKEPEREQWKRGYIYANGEVNTMFRFYCAGYAQGRIVYMTPGEQ